MAQKPTRSPALRAYLRLLGNPYASLDVVEKEAATASDFEPLTQPQKEYVRELGNQYAPLSIAEERPANMLHAALQLAAASMRGFENECRRIFRQYIPATENGQLRLHHREFIERNKSEGPAFRLALLRSLQVFDLSDLGIRPQFNRERDQLTEEKLKKLEFEAREAVRKSAR